MRIDNVSNYNYHYNNATNFQALTMNERKIDRVLGKKYGDAARNARPRLEELAKDCDIIIRPKKKETEFEGPFANIFDTFNITVRELGKSSKKKLESSNSLDKFQMCINENLNNQPIEDQLVIYAEHEKKILHGLKTGDWSAFD